MARIYPLFSSSQGNATFIGTEKGGILIDAGVSCKKLCEALKVNKLTPESVKAIFITHEHSDHIKGLKVFGSKINCPIYGKKQSLEFLIREDKISPKNPVMEITKSISVCGMEVSAFNTPHDSVASCGYRVHTADYKYCAVCTDLGHITPEVENALMGCRLVLLESNYDENMLRTGDYPLSIKQRILSMNGHLSNDECASQIRKLIKKGTKYFVLGHLSPENNRPQIADRTVQLALSKYKRNVDYMLGVAPKETKGGVVIF
ncbi:MAG: MBL fold metallo-hydrolase [Oscillospiraceae bacterium]|nr:MBL fold metallo-hydrolase [Oscillospiraceae bacterium]